MNNLLQILNYIGYISTIIFVLIIIKGIILYWKGIIPVLLRLGNALSKRKIVIFARGDNAKSLENLLKDSYMIKINNFTSILKIGDIGEAENKNLFLMHWHDWSENIDDILLKKSDSTPLIIYAPQELGSIPQNAVKKINQHRNVIVVNFRGRLVNDIIVSLLL